MGYDNSGTANQTLILRWNGTAWKVERSSDPGGSTNDSELSGVAATSSHNAWAVGYYYNGTADQTMIEHWNGKAWKVQPSPNPGGSAHSNDLSGVAAISSTNAWAVGSYFDGTTSQTLVEHWNGQKWKVNRARAPAAQRLRQGLRRAALSGSTIGLSGVAATSVGQRLGGGVRCSQAARRRPSSSIGTARRGRCSRARPRRQLATHQRPRRRGRDLLHQRLGGGQLLKHGIRRPWSSTGTARPGRSSRAQTPADEPPASPTWPPPPQERLGGGQLQQPLRTTSDRALERQGLEDPAQFKFPGRRPFRRGCHLLQRRVGSGHYYNGTNDQNLILHCC